MKVSGRKDALKVLKVGKTIADEVEANRHLLHASLRPRMKFIPGAF